MKNDWQTKLKKLAERTKVSPQLAPIISGGAVLYLLKDIIFSNLNEFKFAFGLLAVIILFITSAILYFVLGKLEKEKDVYLLSVIGRTVGDVFKRYGQKMAELNSDNAKAKDMNKIMQTIVNLVKNMKILGNKKYRE